MCAAWPASEHRLNSVNINNVDFFVEWHRVSFYKEGSILPWPAPAFFVANIPSLTRPGSLNANKFMSGRRKASHPKSENRKCAIEFRNVLLYIYSITFNLKVFIWFLTWVTYFLFSTPSNGPSFSRVLYSWYPSSLPSPPLFVALLSSPLFTFPQPPVEVSEPWGVTHTGHLLPCYQDPCHHVGKHEESLDLKIIKVLD